MTLIINARHFFYGFSLLDKYKGTGKAKPYMIFALTDETYSLVCTAKIPEGIDEKKYYLFLSILDQLYWISGCTIGALLGTFIPFNSTGIDFAMTALFVVIFVEQWLSTKEHLPAILGAVTTLVCLFVFGAQYFIIPSMALIAVELVIFRKRFEKSNLDSEKTKSGVSENGQ